MLTFLMIVAFVVFVVVVVVNSLLFKSSRSSAESTTEPLHLYTKPWTAMSGAFSCKKRNPPNVGGFQKVL